MYLHGTSRINAQGHLEIGGCDTVALAAEFGTPLYVMDEQLIREQMRSFQQAAKRTGMPFCVGYASKAFSTLAMCRIVDEEGLLLDVVSAGKLHTALQADFPAERIYFHGNNKTPDELIFALEVGIGLFVVDNFYEMTLLQALAAEKNVQARILLRIAPGVTGATHAYIQTGQADTKFGFDLSNGQAQKAVEQALQASHLDLAGLHCHLGSQLFEVDIFRGAISKLAQLAETCREQFDWQLRILNVGGGFGIRYQAGDTPRPAADYVQAIAAAVKANFAELPEVWIEPGRRLVGEAGTTLYRIGSIKDIPGIRKYVSVDGGMTDNLRPALYQAKYEAMLTNHGMEQEVETVSIAGRCCESGDMLIWDCTLPVVESGDLLAVSCTGAYNYAMANNYNRLTKPAVVFVRDGQADLVVERETLADLTTKDRIPARLRKTAVVK